MDLSIATYNVCGLRDSNKRRKIFHYLHQKNYNVIFLQDTHSTPAVERYWRAEWGGEIFYAHGSSESRGCAILFTRGSLFKKLQICKDVQG